MKKQFLTLAIIAALGACSSDDESGVSTPTPADITGDKTGTATKAANATGTLTVNDVNPGESLVYPSTTTGLYGTFSINAAGEWEYKIDTANEQIIALVSAAMDPLVESPFTITTADGTTENISISVAGIDVPATFSGALSYSVVYDDGNANATVTVQDDNPAEASFAPDQTPIANYGAVTFDSVSGEWMYDLDESIEAVKALNYVEDTDTPPSVEDTFIIKSLDGTEQVVTIRVLGSQLIDADIDGIPGGVDVEPEEGQEPVRNPDVFVNINAGNADGMLIITDPNFEQEKFEVMSDITSTYGTYSIDESGSWTYTLNEELDAIKNHKGDGVTLPDPLIDELAISSADGTTATIPININPLVGGNLAAHLGSSDGKDAKWAIDIQDLTAVQGKASFIGEYPNESTKDVKLIFSGSKWKGKELHRTYLALTVRSNGELRLNNETGNGKYHTLDNTIEKGKPFLVEFTWDSSAGTPALLSLYIDGNPISSDAMTINEDNTFSSMTVGGSLQNNGPGYFDVQTKGGSPFIIDDFTLYSDVAGNTEVFSETFESSDDNEFLEGKEFTYDKLYTSGSNGSTANSASLVIPLTKP
ncbi:VCBS domain-containing protein [Psychrosphaera sp. B3R10]|uniref:VCBS domain-containing protein n=1 Tax=unclassified Psychrosphaera TaxID=2641570 RepID=UPI001C08ABE6|nr:MULTISPECIES: VCBS domain-containing protein [unclassified Psychrosphaera]MBU2883532.1 VCBS domain-containing protein [Psychrosphaera sp. I2R16]MBU2989711.1 VCBS domain-containing protein [Psychrosphaera sp. B3R10]MDO6719835.1 VCBS domain-containing protein [Psychrosphaera sp. 1_MG-2023]